MKRRKVFRVAIVYAITAWLVIQIAAIAFPAFGMPEWTLRGIMIVVAIGFPIALVLAWALEVTPDGIQPTSPQSTPVAPGRTKLDYVIVGLLVVAVAWLLFRTEIDTPDVPVASATTEAAIEPVKMQSADQAELNNSIAVLPFENFSPDPDNAYFASGIHEELLNQLAKIKDLSILARTTMSRYADSELSVPEIGRELNVGAVMEGSVRYAGKRVRITAQLIDVKTGTHLWSQTYDRDLEDIFEIQSDIALKITEAMKVEFSVAEQASIRKPLTNNPEAYAHYVRAMSWLSRPMPDLRAVQEDLDKAIEADPLFAEALGLQAFYYANAAVLDTEEVPVTPESQTRNAELAVKYARRALAVDPNIAVAYLALSRVAEISRDWGLAFAHAERGYELYTNQGWVIWQYGVQLLRRGKIDEAIVLMDQAIALNPMDINLPLFSGAEMIYANRWNDARRYARHVITLVPDAYQPYMHLTAAAAWSGDRNLAIEMAQETELRAQGSTLPDGYIILLDVYTRFGMEEDAARILAKLHEIDATRGLNDGEWAQLYAVVGDADKAFEHMNAMIDNNFPFFPVLLVLVYAPQFNIWDNIRDDPRFEAARIKIGLPE